MNYKDFDDAISEAKIQSLDRALAILWFGKVVYGIQGMPAKEIASIIENECGHPRQNTSRLHDQLRADRRTAKNGPNGFRLRPDAEKTLGQQYGGLISVPSAPRLRV